MNKLEKFLIIIITVPAMIALGMFDYDQNMVNLDSITGSIAFTYGGVALMFSGERSHSKIAKTIAITLGIFCSCQSGLFNYDAQMKPHREQANIRLLIAEEKANKYSVEEIQECYRSNCKSDDYRQYNNNADLRIRDLEERKDYSWVEPDQTTRIKTYGAALLPPMLMNALAFFLSLTLFQEKRKKNVGAWSKLVNCLVSRNVSGVSGNVSNVSSLNNEKSSYTDHQSKIMKEVYEKMFYESGGVEPKKKVWHAEVKRHTKGLSRHDRIQLWWNEQRPNLEPPPAPEQPRPIKVYKTEPANGFH